MAERTMLLVLTAVAGVSCVTGVTRVNGADGTG
jgi:hypothetical protein